MASVIGDLMYPTGKYIKDGQEKTRWMKVGVLIETDKGMRLKIEAIPVVTGDNGLWLSVFEPRDSQAEAKPARPQATSTPDPQQDVPF
jgi:hypothetical protein